MGLDLTLVPYKHGNEEKMVREHSILAYTRIDLTRNYALFSYILEMGSDFKRPVFEIRELAGTLEWYDDEGIESTGTDPYGAPLTYCLAKEFGKIDLSKIDTCQWNKAAIEMMRRLPEDTPVILYWY